MTKKKTIAIVLVIIIASLVAYFYLADFYKSDDLDKIYTADDFPNALKTMNQEILELSLEDLNNQYQDLKNGEYIYISWINVGILKKRLGNNSGAEKAWLEAIDYNPNRSLAIGNLADLYLFSLGQYEKAEEYYLRVLNIKTDNFTHYHGLVSLYRYNMTEKVNLIEGIMLEGAKVNQTGKENYYMYLANYFAEGPDNKGGNDKEKAKYYTQEVLKINPDLKDQLPDL